MLLRFSLLTSIRAGTLQTLGHAYGFQVLHLEFTEALTVSRAAPRPPAELRRVCGGLRVTDPTAFQSALRRRIGRHQGCGHPEVGVLVVGAWAQPVEGFDVEAPFSLWRPVQTPGRPNGGDAVEIQPEQTGPHPGLGRAHGADPLASC